MYTTRATHAETRSDTTTRIAPPSQSFVNAQRPPKFGRHRSLTKQLESYKLMDSPIVRDLTYGWLLSARLHANHRGSVVQRDSYRNEDFRVAEYFILAGEVTKGNVDKHVANQLSRTTRVTRISEIK